MNKKPGLELVVSVAGVPVCMGDVSYIAGKMYTSPSTVRGWAAGRGAPYLKAERLEKLYVYTTRTGVEVLTADEIERKYHCSVWRFYHGNVPRVKRFQRQPWSLPSEEIIELCNAAREFWRSEKAAARKR